MQSTVNKYAKVTAQRKELKKIELELRDKLIRYLRRYRCPLGGPFVITLSEFERTEFSWELFCKKQLKAEGYSIREIKTMIKVAKAKAGTTPVDTLHVEVNPKWGK